jgi:uncharacterized protein
VFLASDGLIFSASDLVAFLECEHLGRLEFEVATGRRARPDGRTETADLLARRGEAHERACLEALRAPGRTVVEIDRGDGDWARAARETKAALRAGADIVYQAVFLAGGWLGIADFARKVPVPSAFGAWSYELADAKLARREKPQFILQLCLCSELLAGVQGVAPERMHVVLSSGQERWFRYRDVAAYFRAVRARFERVVRERSWAPPYPVPHCELCAFAPECAAGWRREDHLCLVAGIRRDEVAALEAAGIATAAALAAAPAGLNVDLGARAFERLRQQAALQVAARRDGRHRYELLPPESGRGFALLPRPSPGDVFFDVEGDPLFDGGRGLEYLFGVMTFEAGRPVYRPDWAHEPAEERRAFERFVDLVWDRLEHHPDMHVYHYASYEPTALKRLMGLHGTREDQLDELLRRHIFVDLYRIVRQALRASCSDYSLKSLRRLFMDPEPEGGVATAAESVVRYEQWRESGDRALLEAIAAYNERDCLSLVRLRDWLVDRRAEAEVQFGTSIAWKRVLGPDDVTRPEPEEGRTELERALVVGVPDDPALASSRQPARGLLANLLHYHRREAKPAWWAYFDRLEATEDELIDDLDAIAGLEPVGGPEPDKKSLVHTLRFPPQEHRLRPGRVDDPATREGVRLAQSAGELRDVDDERGLLRLRRGPKLADVPLPRAVVAPGPVPDKEQREALVRLARHVVSAGLDGPGRYRAVRQILCRDVPSVRGRATGAELQTLDLDEQCDLVARLDESYLFVQGPPGTGKTWLGARLVTHLLEVRPDVRIGVAGPSHKAINNLLREVERTAESEGVAFRGLKKSTDDPESEFDGDFISSSSDNRRFEHPDADVRLVAGTAWLFARGGLDGALDYLFIDEAGQVSLADALAMGTAARNIVLLGDPLQLAHVSQGVHPPGAAVSVLEHLLGEQATVPVDRGLFLARTRRLHPDICRFVSEVVYEGRLESSPGCERQRIEAAGALSGTGLRFVPVEHSGNAQRSTQEAAVVAATVKALLETGEWTDRDGVRRRLAPGDLLVVAPYNVQVRCLRQALPHGVAVGTVDKFQGREAAVVFFSMATSSGDDLPRHFEFLFSLNRLNVALSRAKALAVLVASPRLLEVRCRTVEQLRLVNALCRFAEMAEEVRIDT